MSTVHNRLRKIKEQLNNGKVIMVNGPEVWTRPGCDGLTHGMDGI